MSVFSKVFPSLFNAGYPVPYVQTRVAFWISTGAVFYGLVKLRTALIDTEENINHPRHPRFAAPYNHDQVKDQY
ncbi:hypothetical protein NADFUDRAFT_52666 [Nadsonia fulvescens var. elongata DSM 6958]|uniref:Uncharacterized protein n=1 Tax=Nadsonia fulvescens var. elongata DSM 6958 TaxID=857566 RepID=A0A1E3PFY1_9ASCO|nr:hypothetical protein NADFUDRAFT_52666 [Nadsonia fulvescens var. elongata DSM 6958]